MMQTFYKKQDDMSVTVSFAFPDKPTKVQKAEIQNLVNSFKFDRNLDNKHFDRVALFAKMREYGYEKYCTPLLVEKDVEK